MASVAAKTLEGEAYEAAYNFEKEFDLEKMDTMIYRFPPGLGEIISSRYSYMVAPRFVAIGPYHHGKKHLEKMEAVKKAAAHFLWQRSPTLEQAVRMAAAHYKLKGALNDAAAAEVVGAVNEALGFYFGKTVKEEGMKAQLADMMIYDACFLLLYMDAYNRSHGKEVDKDYQVDPSMRRFLFSNRDRINNDIMLLENQLPWRVIQVLIGLASDLNLNKAVGFFIAAMGSSFRVSESSNLQAYEWDDKKNPPAHLLALLRRHKTQEPADNKTSSSTNVDDDIENNNSHPLSPSSSSTLNNPLITQQAPTPAPHTSSPTQAGGSSSTRVDVLSDDDDIENNNQEGNRDEVVVSAISPTDLEQIGIKLTGDPAANFSAMGLEKRWLCSRLKLAPLSLDDTGASWLVNMAAFEVCTASSFGDPPEKTAVCSYLALLAFFMVGIDDVRKLRSMGLLKGPNRDDDMLAFFETLKKHLPDYGAHFAKVMADVEDYQRKRRVRTTVYRWVYNNWKTVGTVVSIVVAVATTIAALIRLYQELRALIHN